MTCWTWSWPKVMFLVADPVTDIDFLPGVLCFWIWTSTPSRFSFTKWPSPRMRLPASFWFHPLPCASNTSRSAELCAIRLSHVNSLWHVRHPLCLRIVYIVDDTEKRLKGSLLVAEDSLRVVRRHQSLPPTVPCARERCGDHFLLPENPKLVRDVQNPPQYFSSRFGSVIGPSQKLEYFYKPWE